MQRGNLMIVSAHDKKVFEPVGFLSEKELQDSIANLPSLLNVIPQLNGQDYPLYILKRELGVASGSIDFLATDVDGSLYIIETKLAENPELRRTVIGQVLEYASNLTDTPYEHINSECLRYLKKHGSLEQAIHDFYAQQGKDGEPIPTASEYKEIIADNLANGRFNLVIVANKVSFEIQKLFHYIDQVTKDNLNFIVLEINKYHFDSGVVLHSGIVWAAKYIKTLFSRTVINEEAYIASKSPHVQMLIRHIDKQCTAKGLSKNANTRGLSWKHSSGGSIFITGDTLDTNWSTLPVKPGEMRELDDCKKTVMETASKVGLIPVHSKHGCIRLKLNDKVQIEDVDRFIDLALSVIQKASSLSAAKQYST